MQILKPKRIKSNMDLMKHKLIFFVFSLVMILPGIYFLSTSGLKFGIDFTGGALMEYQFGQTISKDDIKNDITNLGVEVGAVIDSGANTYIIRTKPIEASKLNEVKIFLKNKYPDAVDRRVENVGPVIGEELERKALIGILTASVAIVVYIAWSFRKVPKPTSSWRFGAAAIVALLHDVLIVVGAFAFFGKYFGVEIDTLFVTALLTVIGFSVHDTIVVFDRIRENLLKNVGKKFSDIVNVSVIQTLGRSLNTSLTVVFVLFAMLIFGGESIKWFVVALLIGIISGTYSSIFNASALLAWWEERLGH